MTPPRKRITKDQYEFLRREKNMSDADIRDLYDIAGEPPRKRAGVDLSARDMDADLEGFSNAVRGIVQGRTLGFGDEAIGTLRGILPGGPSIREAIAEEREAVNALPATGRAVAEIAGGLGAAKGRMGRLLTGQTAKRRIVGSAAGGALSGVGHAEDSEDAVIAALLGATAGGALGAGGEALLVNPTKFLTIGGGVAGATQGDNPLERGRNALLGAAGGYGTQRGGAALIRRAGASGLLPTPRDRAMAALARAKARSGVTDEQVRALATDEVPGMTIVDSDIFGGPLPRLARTAESFPSEGGKKIREFFQSRTAIAPARAEKSVRRAMGNRYEEPNEIIERAKQTVSRKSRPLYEKAYEYEVSDPRIRRMFDDPDIQQAYREAQELAAKEARAGMGDLLPDLFEVNEEGAVKFLSKAIPVRAIDYMKRGLDRHIHRTNADKQTARILKKQVGDMLRYTDELVPEYKAARRVYGQATEKQVQGLARQKGSADFITGNSQTQRIAADQDDFTGNVKLSDFNLMNLFERMGNSALANRLRGLDEATIDALEPYLTRPLAAGGAEEILEALQAHAIREAERRARAAAVHQGAALVAGAGVGSSLRTSRGR